MTCWYRYDTKQQDSNNYQGRAMLVENTNDENSAMSAFMAVPETLYDPA